MAVLAEFNPETSSYGLSGNAFASGLEQGQSMMARAQALRLQQQQADQQRAEFAAKLPLIQAQAQLETTNAAAAVRNATHITNWEQQAAVDSITANKEFTDAVSYNAGDDVPASDGTPEGDAAQTEAGKYATQATLDTRSQKLAELSAKYSYMSNLPQYKGFIDRVNSEAAQAHLAAAQNLKLDELMTMAQARADAVRFGAVTRADATVGAAGIRADASTQNTDTRVQGRLSEMQMRNEGRLDQIRAQGTNAVEKDARTIQFLSDQAVKDEQNAASVQQDDPATAEVLRQNAARLRDLQVKKANFAGGTPSTPNAAGTPVPRPTAAPEVAAARQAYINSPSPSISVPGSEPAAQPEAPAQAAPPAVAPTKVPKDAVSVDIGGKTYPVFKDKNGNRAYKVDGHYVPIDTE